MKNKIEDLRNQLFLTLEKLQDGDMEIDRAEQIAKIGQVIVNSAKIEVDYLRHVNQSSMGSGFIPIDPEEKKRLGE